MALALISATIIIIISLFVAYVCFNILDSSAQANLKEWKLGGAFAAFIFTASMLTSMVLQFNRIMTKDQVEELRNQLLDEKEESNRLITELQSKLIRGAPTPKGFTIDVDERHNLVFARPISWIAKNGILYNYIEPDKESRFKANFNVIYQTIDEIAELYKALGWGNFDATIPNIEDLYSNVANATIEFMKSILTTSSTPTISDEYIFIDGLKSLKRNCIYEDTHGNKFQFIGTYIYVPKLNALYEFTFTDSNEEFLKSSEIFTNVVQSIRFL
jgi:hypothetical protein